MNARAVVTSALLKGAAYVTTLVILSLLGVTLGHTEILTCAVVVFVGTSVSSFIFGRVITARRHDIRRAGLDTPQAANRPTAH